VIAVDLLAGQPGDVEEGTQPHLVRPLGQHLQAQLGDDAILAHERHHVGERADRRNLDERRQPVGLARPQAQRLHELERDAHAGQVLVGIRTVVPLGIDDRDGIRQIAVGLVVVGDDEIEAQLARASRRVGAADAAVHGDDDLDALGVEPLERGRLQAVAIAEPLGDEMRHLPAEQLERTAQNHGGRDAVDVVITMNGDALAVGQGPQQPLDGAIHVGQPHRIEQVIERGLQKS
jgi:hypothetical protein